MKLSKEQTQLLNQVAIECGLSDYTVVTTPGSSKGDNFLGVITAVTLKSDEKSLDLVLKSAQTNDAFRKAAPLRAMYEREIYLYQHIFKEFKKFEEEHDIPNPFNSTARSYASTTENKHECFLLENLKTDGYQLWDKKIPMNSEHIKAVLKEYAKFHAISLAMKNKKNKLFKDLTENIKEDVFECGETFTDIKQLVAFIEITMANGYKVVEDDPVLTERLQNMESAMKDFFLEELKDEEYKLVVNHGDTWCNNFMFKYKDSADATIPSSLRILDWQISSVSTPAQDICYFFLAHSSEETLRDYQSYFQLYYDTLSIQLRHFNCDPEEIFPYSMLEKHLKTFMKFGLFMGFMIIKVMLSDSDEVPDFEEVSEQHGGLAEGMNFKLKDFDGYRKRVKPLIQFMKDNNFF